MKLFLQAHITAVLIAVFISPVFAASVGQVSVTTLPSGMKVIVREGHAINLAAVDIWIKAGSVNETSANNGVSHFVEHMIFKATEKYGPGQIDREIEGLGAELNGGTSRDYVHFYTTVASEYLPTALNVLADAITNARFNPEDMEKERQVILDEIARAESDPSRHAVNLFSRTAYTEHPYRMPPMGTKESISKLTRDELAAYYNQYYTPANTCVVIAGDVTRSNVPTLVQGAFSGYTKAAQANTAPPAELPLASPKIQEFRSTVSDTFIVLGYHAPPASEFREVCALDVALALLGDTYRGRVSMALNARNIRFNKVTTEFIVQRYPSTFSILVSANPEDADKVAPVLLTELRRLGNEPIPKDELENAKRLVEGSDLFDQETFSGQARALGLYEMVASYDLALKYDSVVRSITASDITAAAAKYFTDTGYCMVTIRPEGAEK